MISNRIVKLTIVVQAPQRSTGDLYGRFVMSCASHAVGKRRKMILQKTQEMKSEVLVRLTNQLNTTAELDATLR